MNYTNIINQLEAHKKVFESLLKAITPEMIIWKPSSDKWCLLEIICHLHDEEIYDFRTRVRHTLENSETPPPSIDPIGWVTEHDYKNQSFHSVVDNFLFERNQSVEWLKSLGDPDWTLGYTHQHWGRFSAGKFLANWLAHDFIHIRQINRTVYQYFESQTKHKLNYAGDW